MFFKKFKKQKQKAASLIEAMVALSLIAFAALGIYPILIQSKKIALRTDFYDLCMNAARTKLNEYKLGAASGIVGTSMTTDVAVDVSPNASGFYYSKLRFNQNEAIYCPTSAGSTPQTVVQMPPAVRAHLGAQECVAPIGSPHPTGGALPAGFCRGLSTLDTQLLGYTKNNFKLYVNLRRYNTTVGALGATGSPFAGMPVNSPQPVEDCPIVVPAAAPGVNNAYNFLQAGDMIKITVTGIIDLAATENFQGISATDSRLTCQISDFIRPYPQIARYWMQDDGTIHLWRSPGDVNLAQAFSVSATPANLGFVVSPDNRFLYILQPGKLIRYEGCSDVLDTTTGGGNSGVNCNAANRMVWNIDPKIVSITAKFTGAIPNYPIATCGNPTVDTVGNTGLPIIFGLLADHQTMVCIDLPSVGIGGDPDLGAPPVDTGVWQFEIGIPFTPPQNANRIHSIFSDAKLNTTYVVDLSGTFNVDLFGLPVDVLTSTYRGGIYNINDTEMRWPIEVFSTRAIAFSK